MAPVQVPREMCIYSANRVSIFSISFQFKFSIFIFILVQGAFFAFGVIPFESRFGQSAAEVLLFWRNREGSSTSKIFDL